MIRLCKWKWTILVCVLAVAVGVLHCMTHVEFQEYYSELFNDIDELCELIAKYVSHIVVKLGYDDTSDKLKEVTDHYNLMVNRAQPLFEIFISDMESLSDFIETLESVSLTKKFLYSYFRQSAINLIEHLKRVYSLD